MYLYKSSVFGTAFVYVSSNVKTKYKFKVLEDRVMKRLMIILAIVFSSAQIYASRLVVKGNIDAPFSVFIGGEKYYSYKNEVNISNLPRGVYRMEVYVEGAAYEQLYDCSIDIPRNTTVRATFTGDNRMYITKYDNAPTIILDVTPYPHRQVHYAPAPKPVPVYHSTPKPHKAAPAPKPAPKANPAPKPASKPAPKVAESKSTRSGASTSSSRTRTTEARSTTSTRK